MFDPKQHKLVFSVCERVKDIEVRGERGDGDGRRASFDVL